MRHHPPEILYIIVSYVQDQSDLLSVCLASRIFSIIAREELYRHIQLVHLVPTVKICHTIIRSAEIAKRVRTMVFDPFTGNPSGAEILFNHFQHGLVLPSFLRLLSRALRACSGLTTLALMEPGMYGWVLENTSFRLHHFDCHVTIDRSIVSFLKSQYTLRELKLAPACGLHNARDVHEVLQSIADEDCPSLSILRCPHWVARPFLHHRPIGFHVSTIPATNDELSELFRELSSSTGPLQGVHFTVMARPSSELIRALTLNVGLCNLDVVEFHLPHLYSLAEQDFDIMQSIGVFTENGSLHAFASLSNLSMLNFMIAAVADATDLEFKVDQAAQLLSRALGSVCPLLQSVSVGIGEGSAGAETIRSVCVRFLGPNQERMRALFGLTLEEGGWMDYHRLTSFVQNPLQGHL